MDIATARDHLPEYLLGTLDPAHAERVEAALAASPRLRAEAEALGRVLFALPEALEPEPLPSDAWTRLHTTVVGDAIGVDRSHPSPGAPAASTAAPTRATSAASAKLDGMPSGVPIPAAPSRAKSHSTAGSTRRSRIPVLALALAASLAVLAGVGSWGIRGAQARAELANQQRIISYWMRNPELQIVSLQGVGPGAVVAEGTPPEIPAGIVCILPDGRSMMLQPYAAPDGSRYVLYGVGPDGRTELGVTRDRFLLFDAAGLRGVELVVEGRLDAVVAEATF